MISLFRQLNDVLSYKQMWVGINHRENTRREESKYLECENRQLVLFAIAAYIFKPPTEKFKIGR